MSGTNRLIAEDLENSGKTTETITVSLSNELVQLLSDQLYQSPLKAVEELVVNAYDADATECRVFIPDSSDLADGHVVVFDNGIGMNTKGIADLWQIGRSNKRSEEVSRRSNRKQIGKFGIGKLATYAIANKVTYITRTGLETLAVTLDFRDFTESPTGAGAPVTLDVKIIEDTEKFIEETRFGEICQVTGVPPQNLFDKTNHAWTFAILEDLKPKVRKLTKGRLNWVLSTAMPLKSDFVLYLNSEQVVSSKESFKAVVSFNVVELPSRRIKTLTESTGEEWKIVDNEKLVCESFKEGILGTVEVTERSLRAGKSSDLDRSHGFFIRVRDRLINQEDEFFGLQLSSMETFSRFQADIRCDDLDTAITAPREGIEESSLKVNFQRVLLELYNEARGQYEKHLAEKDGQSRRRKESERDFVSPRLVEHAVADVLAIQGSDSTGSEADESWFYFELDKDTVVNELVRSLYSSPRAKYHYQYTGIGPSERLVKFNPATSTFWINSDHDLVKAHSDNGRARILLEDIVTAETLLEVYLRESNVPTYTIGEVLERRDALLRSLALDHPFSLKAISTGLRDAATNDHELEVSLVTATRALGFVATHVAGPGEPDGIARLVIYPEGEIKITLEAKASNDVPQLPALDFAGLHEHMKKKGAKGCLLVAPMYPGESKGSESAASTRAKELGISCWTVDQLATIVEAAESRHLTAKNILDIVLNFYAPQDVEKEVARLLEEPGWEIRQLYRAIIDALKQLENRLADAPRNIDQIATLITLRPEFSNIGYKNIEEAIRSFAASSQGGIILRGEKTLIINASYEEIERRVEGLTRIPGKPRRKSAFRQE